jgi:hypothetical protein
MQRVSPELPPVPQRDIYESKESCERCYEKTARAMHECAAKGGMMITAKNFVGVLVGSARKISFRHVLESLRHPLFGAVK